MYLSGFLSWVSSLGGGFTRWYHVGAIASVAGRRSRRKSEGESRWWALIWAAA